MGDILTSFEYGIPAAIIVAVYLIVNKIIDTKSNKKQAIINTDLVDSFNKLNKFLDYLTKDIIEKEQNKGKFAIKHSFDSFCNNLVKTAIEIIIHNNVNNNREAIIDNVQQVVKTEYWNVYSCFLLYKAGSDRVSDYLEENWKDELTSDIDDIIFDKDKTKEQRIYDVVNKIHIRIEAYKIRVLNRYYTNT